MVQVLHRDLGAGGCLCSDGEHLPASASLPSESRCRHRRGSDAVHFFLHRLLRERIRNHESKLSKRRQFIASSTCGRGKRKCPVTGWSCSPWTQTPPAVRLGHGEGCCIGCLCARDRTVPEEDQWVSRLSEPQNRGCVSLYTSVAIAAIIYCFHVLSLARKGIFQDI